MATRLVILLLCAVGLAACADVSDESESTPTVTLEANEPAEASPTLVASTASPTVTSTLVPRALMTPPPPPPTSLPGDPGEVELDEACVNGERESPLLDGEATLPVAGRLSEFAGPFEPAPFVADATLQATLDAAVGSQAESYAFYVKDLRTGRGAVHNGERVFNAASLFKLFVMYEVFRQESLGLVSWNDELVITPHYDGFALSPRVTQLCQVLTLAEATEAMLSVSDNAAAVLLQDVTGSGNVNASIESLGLTSSGLFQDGLPVTAVDLGLLMEAIAAGEAVSAAASAEMVQLLDHDVFRNGLVDGVPEGTLVARKTGNWADATNVAGIVYAPSGPYVFIALTSNGYETAVIRALSTMTYGHFEATLAP